MRKVDLSNYKAVILAGGRGTRLYPVTKEIPKPLLPVKKKPIVNYLVDLFYSQGVKDIALLINKDFREDFNWWRRRYFPENNIKLVEEKEPLGTFGGLYFLKDWISDNSFFVTNGDELKKIDLIKMSRFHQELKRPATIALVQVPDPEHYGVVICEKGRVKQFLEKPKVPPSKYINSGFYLFSPEIFKYPACRQAWHQGPRFLMTERDLFPKLAQEGKLSGFEFDGKWRDCGTWERYEKALAEWE